MLLLSLISFPLSCLKRCEMTSETETNYSHFEEDEPLKAICFGHLSHVDEFRDMGK